MKTGDPVILNYASGRQADAVVTDPEMPAIAQCGKTYYLLHQAGTFHRLKFRGTDISEVGDALGHYAAYGRHPEVVRPPAAVVTTYDMIPRVRRVCNGCGRYRLTTKHGLADGTSWHLCNDCLAAGGASQADAP